MQTLKMTAPCIAIALIVTACSGEMADRPGSPAAADTGGEAAGASTAGSALLPEGREALVALGLEHDSAWALYQSLLAAADGGSPLDRSDMPDWSGLWTREGAPFYDPDQDPDQLTSARLTPDARAELEQRRALSEQGIEYDPISDCSPPGFPRWLAIPFLREFIVTPGQVWLTSETVNNIRRIYTDGRDHLPEADRYPLWYGDSIGFWSGHTLVIHTNQLRENVFHRNDPRHSDQIETVEVWRKVADDTIIADVWAYDPVTLVEPWYTRQTYRKLTNDDRSLRVRYWHCSENDNNVVIQTDEGTSQFGDFTFTDDE